MSDTNCFRERWEPGLVAEIWSDVVVLHAYEGQYRGDLDVLKTRATIEREKRSARSVYLKPFPLDRNRPEAFLPWDSRLPLVGEAVEELVVRENGHRFLIRPPETFSVGLFMDQRAHRAFLQNRVQGKRVLNLFAYTCGFSVYAAKGGATEVVSVDLSGRYLEWGQQNFRQNDLPVADHKFYRTDVMEQLRRSHKRGERFDRIILDPPTFSRNDRGKVFRIAKDWPELWQACGALLPAGGELFFSCNFAGWSRGDFETAWRQAIGERLDKVIPLPALPDDFREEKEPLHAVLVSLR